MSKSPSPTDEVFPLVYGELQRLARSVRGAGETLNTTALVHEADLKLVWSDGTEWAGRPRDPGRLGRSAEAGDVRRQAAAGAPPGTS